MRATPEHLISTEVDLDAIFRRLQRGSTDPTHQRRGQTWWRTSNNPGGPVLLAVTRKDQHQVRAVALGPGADWALTQLPRLLGADDRPADFTPDHEGLRSLQRKNPQLRIGATDLLFEALVPAILEQKVTAVEAYAAFRALVRKFGQPAPSPDSGGFSDYPQLMVLPSAQEWIEIPSWFWRRALVDIKRETAIKTVAARSAALERIQPRETADHQLADRQVQSLRGIGPWTSAEERSRAHADSDAWSTGDYHIPGMINFYLSGEALDDSERADELLEQFRPHRLRVQLLLMKSGFTRQSSKMKQQFVELARRGPRRQLPTHLPNFPG